MKHYSTRPNLQQATKDATLLNMQGYTTMIEPTGSGFTVYVATTPQQARATNKHGKPQRPNGRRVSKRPAFRWTFTHTIILWLLFWLFLWAAAKSM